MKLIELAVPGAVVVEGEPNVDERGSFTRLFDRSAFAAAGLETEWEQGSASFSPRAGTLRGLHWQAAPHEEVKLVRCVRGALYDVVVDLRPGVGFGRWDAIELRSGDLRSVYVPAGCAHGFQTLQDDTEVAYLMSPAYVPELARGARWDDPAFGIDWPPPPPGGLILSARDRAHPSVVP